MPPLKGKTEERRIAINKGYKALVCNTIPDGFLAEDTIDYDWYIQQTQDLIGGFDV